MSADFQQTLATFGEDFKTHLDMHSAVQVDRLGKLASESMAVVQRLSEDRDLDALVAACAEALHIQDVLKAHSEYVDSFDLGTVSTAIRRMAKERRQ